MKFWVLWWRFLLIPGKFLVLHVNDTMLGPVVGWGLIAWKFCCPRCRWNILVLQSFFVSSSFAIFTFFRWKLRSLMWWFPRCIVIFHYVALVVSLVEVLLQRLLLWRMLDSVCLARRRWSPISVFTLRRKISIDFRWQSSSWMQMSSLQYFVYRGYDLVVYT